MDPTSTVKKGLRAEILAARRAMTRETREHHEALHTQRVLALPAVESATVVATYASVGSEPGTRHLIDELSASGNRVLLPRLAPDNDLDWSDYEPGRGVVQAARGLVEPPGELLGIEAIAAADVVVVPGLAATPRGERLGRGGGSYDRALARVAPDVPVICLLYPQEVTGALPTEDHDRPVSMIVTSEATTSCA